MIVRYAPVIIKKLKKVDVRIRKRFKQHLKLFEKNPLDPILNNHPLGSKYSGYRSINITTDYRAIYQEKEEDDETVAYFTLFGTHQELYG